VNIDFQYIIGIYIVSKAQAKKMFQEFMNKHIQQDALEVTLTPHEELLETTHPIVKIIDEVITPFPKPAIYLSGGIDSTILLHHLSMKTDEPIHSYTFAFFKDENEFEEAETVAEYYGTIHHEVVIDNFTGRFPEILRHLSRPRFNVQTYWLAEQAQRDGRRTCYIGEGLDEHFGGYWYKPHLNYLESWVDHFQYIRPAHKEIHDIFGLNCEIPFTYLDFRKTLPYWDPSREKLHLKKAYSGILPDFVVQRRKNPGRPHYRKLWDRELSKIYSEMEPKSDEEIRRLLNKYATAIWLGVHP